MFLIFRCSFLAPGVHAAFSGLELGTFDDVASPVPVPIRVDARASGRILALPVTMYCGRGLGLLPHIEWLVTRQSFGIHSKVSLKTQIFRTREPMTLSSEATISYCQGLSPQTLQCYHGDPSV